MGARSLLCWMAMFGVLLVGCERAEPRPERIEVTSAHRSCEEGEACGVVETSCQSQGCECGVAINEAHVLEIGRASCRDRV